MWEVFTVRRRNGEGEVRKGKSSPGRKNCRVKTWGGALTFPGPGETLASDQGRRHGKLWAPSPGSVFSPGAQAMLSFLPPLLTSATLILCLRAFRSL